MDDVKKCSKCEKEFPKSNFHRNTKTSDGFNPQFKLCGKKYYQENLLEIKKYYLYNRDRKKDYYLKNRDKINTRMNEYVENRIKTDVIFRLIRNTRRRIHHALNGESKSSSTKEILGIDVDSYKKWIELQFTPEMNWENIEIDHVKPICLFDVTEDDEAKEAFCWKSTQPLLNQDHQKKCTKFNFLDYQLQFIKAYQFIKLNV